MKMLELIFDDEIRKDDSNKSASWVHRKGIQHIGTHRAIWPQPQQNSVKQCQYFLIRLSLSSSTSTLWDFRMFERWIWFRFDLRQPIRQATMRQLRSVILILLHQRATLKLGIFSINNEYIPCPNVASDTPQIWYNIILLHFEYAIDVFLYQKLTLFGFPVD